MVSSQLLAGAMQATAVAGTGEALQAALVVALTVGLGLLAARFATRLIHRLMAASGPASREASIVVNLVRGLIVLSVVYFVGENVFHVELGGLVQALGITTLVVSLGLQDLIKNLVAGVQILLTGLFSVGDQLEVGGERGEVTDVNWRQTTLRDKDGNLHVVPNAELMGSAFMRRVGRMERRYVVECDIKPGLDLSRVAADIARLADATLSEHGWRADEPTEVRYVGSTANGVRVSIRIFLSDIEYTTRSMDAVMRAIGSRGYLADWTNDSPAQEPWR